jgi:tetratricopeptide (TPR) repeat protein
LSVDEGDAEPALRLASALARYSFRSGLILEGRRLIGDALGTAKPGGGLWWARTLVEDARLARAAGDPGALAATRKAILGCEREDDRDSLAFALGLLAEQHADAGRHEEVRAALARAGDLFTASGNEEGLALVDQTLGNLLFAQGDLDGAATLLGRARDRIRRVRGDLDAGWILVDLAGVLIAQGRPAEAIEPATQAVSDFRRRGDARGVAGAFVSLGRAQARAGDRERGQALLSEARELSRRWGYGAQADAADTALAELSFV